jgi:hypothetical protein
VKRRTLLLLLTLAPVSAAEAPAIAGQPEISTAIVEGVAVGGYDAVSYFSGEPAEGSKDMSVRWKDAEWRFSSAANRDAFTAAPEKYAPQYGGYCAFAVSKGATAKGDPTAWTVSGGKLYLNFSQGVRQTWRMDVPGNVAAADKNWPGVLN